jgi:hypothetical protein
MQALATFCRADLHYPSDHFPRGQPTDVLAVLLRSCYIPAHRMAHNRIYLFIYGARMEPSPLRRMASFGMLRRVAL